MKRTDGTPVKLVSMCAARSKRKAATEAAEPDRDDQLQQRIKSHQQAGSSGRSEARGTIAPEKLDAVKGRTWNKGSGMRPGNILM